MDSGKSYFVFMDMLGFKKTVGIDIHRKIYEVLNECIKVIKQRNISGTIVSISDSIFFKCRNFINVVDFIKIIYDGVINNLIKESKDIPFFIRGAISYGNVTEAFPAGKICAVDELGEQNGETDVVNALNLFGKPIIDAYNLSEKCGMKGARIAIHDSVLNKDEVNAYRKYFNKRKNSKGEKYTEFLWPVLSYDIDEDETVFSKILKSLWHFFEINEKYSSKIHYLSTMALIISSFENHNTNIYSKLCNTMNKLIGPKRTDSKSIIEKINLLKKKDPLPYEIKEYRSLLSKYPELTGHRDDPLKIKTSIDTLQDYIKKINKETFKMGILLKTPYSIVVRDLVENNKGELFDYQRILSPKVLDGYEGVVVIPYVNVNGEKRVLFIKNFRHALRSREIEFPRGFGKKGQRNLETAKEELQQEVGCKSNKWEFLGRVYPDSGMTNNRASVYCVEINLSNCQQNSEKAESISKDFVIASREETFRLIHEGKIRCGFTLSALMLLISKNKL